MTTHQIDLPEMPFYWRIRKSSADQHRSIPGRLSYSFGLRPDIDLVIEKRNDRLLSSLREVYREESNIGFLQDGHTLSKGYGDDFLDFIQRSLAGVRGKRVVEIGCGGCYLLERLSGAGYDVTGVDPSPIAIAKGREKGIRVIPDFFPSSHIDFKADLIFHVDVLEHVDDPVAFLKNQRDALSDEGLAIINVPDCTQSIALGDISIASHQHLNSFDQHSLYKAVTTSGLDVLTIDKSKFGGSLYCLATRSKSPTTSFHDPGDGSNARTFFSKALAASAKFQALMRPLLAAKRSVGFYMPLRAVPYLASLGRLDGVRLFDDIGHWHKGFIDGLDIPIENFDDLVHRPVDHLFIMSLTFGKAVKSKVHAKCPGIGITLLEEILSS
ncbi:MAG TPA: class I SAM-dependent methyltransferase [Burkholderiales bacterium]|jgi:2-polyprenyl-3-methyl-5-hydroxy-6-metoxy-1,4-benzoquinol methylase|nr:class I SAM-dependent methyltransferase [Burkholderiales bacterium]